MADESELPEPVEIIPPIEGEKPTWTRWKDRISEVRETAAQKREALAAARRELSDSVRVLGDDTKDKTVKLIQDPIRTTIDALAASRESRLRTEGENKKGIFGKVGKTARRLIIGTALEYGTSAWSLGAYGIGDGVALVNAAIGKDLYTGDKLDAIDRLIYLGGAVVPWAPAAIAVEASQRIRHRLENTAHVVRKIRPTSDHSNNTE
jgi:Pre-toxin TG